MPAVPTVPVSVPVFVVPGSTNVDVGPQLKPHVASSQPAVVQLAAQPQNAEQAEHECVMPPVPCESTICALHEVDP